MRSGFLASLPYPDPAQALTAPVARNVLCEIRSEPLIAEGKIGSLAKVRHLAQNVVLRRYDRELRIGSHSHSSESFLLGASCSVGPSRRSSWVRSGTTACITVRHAGKSGCAKGGDHDAQQDWRDGWENLVGLG